MRSALFTAIALVVATPTVAAAQSTSETQQDVQGMADTLNDPSTQAAAAGIAAVIQPGGSMRDEDVIAAADEHGMAMVFTGMRHFRH